MKWIILLLLPTLAFAKVKTEKISYELNGVKMEGLLAYNDKYSKPRPGILVIHEWMGIGKFTEQKAIELAHMGYVAFAADIYGVDTRPKDMKEAGEASGKLKGDVILLQARAQAAFEILKNRKEANKDRLAVIGFCFGGTTGLELARSGVDFKALVVFHGNFKTPSPAKKFAPKILVLHGANDPFVTEPEIRDFEKELKGSNADWQFLSYSNTVHSFTNPEAGNDPSKGFAYNKLSSDRAFKQMKIFFDENL